MNTYPQLKYRKRKNQKMEVVFISNNDKERQKFFKMVQDLEDMLSV